ncbi:hypothetical protein [Rhizobacter sp. SG703]|uniref:hypothetical protein n=1 Tax=Rhizobacter sp. SG703 TaxID=2587140 RepID=UPI0014469892|nr:hypothetical protein [Rhizobacter sp. SG703]NKI93661.1 Ran GTPase-activating protein (RanGAP) involved in mRNA processing and transport [Rhizobacter sp. SG703]
MSISSDLKACRPTTPRSSSKPEVCAITSSNPPAFIAQKLQPHTQDSWRQAAKMSLQAVGTKDGAASLEWLSHHSAQGHFADADPMGEAELNLWNMGLTRDDLRKLCAWLQSRKFQAPIKLVLSANDFSNGCAEELAELLKDPSCVIALDLSRCELAKQDIALLCTALRENTGLQKLLLSYNHFQGCGAAIGELLKANKTLQSLGLQGSQEGGLMQMECHCICSIAKALEENSSLQALDLGINVINFEGAVAIASMLKSNKTLIDLNLRFSTLDRGFRTLCKALKSNTTLERLNLSGQALDDKRQAALASLLKANRSLRHLDVSNGIGAKDTTCSAPFYEALSSNITLRSLKITIRSRQVVGALATLLRNPKSHLESIDLRGPRLDAEAVDILTKAVQNNQTLITFHAGHAKPEALSPIHVVTARNKELRERLHDKAGDALIDLLQEQCKAGTVPYLPRDLRHAFAKAFKDMDDMPTVLALLEATAHPAMPG